jgi:hypothetical protein
MLLVDLVASAEIQSHVSQSYLDIGGSHLPVLVGVPRHTLESAKAVHRVPVRRSNARFGT